MNKDGDILTKFGNREKESHKISSQPILNTTPSKRKTQLGPTLSSSPSRRQKTFNLNLNYWIRKDKEWWQYGGTQWSIIAKTRGTKKLAAGL